VEIIRRVLAAVQDPLPRGSILAVPVVNVFGFIGQSRYLPDRRDLNRSFPGSAKGSLASRIAHLVMTEIVDRSTHALDLHTASQDRSNLPQLRGNLEDPETQRCAHAFGAPVMMHAGERTGSLRGAATKRGVTSLVFEGGEAYRFNPSVIEVGVRGVLNVMQELGMLTRKPRKRRAESILIRESSWVRARRGGLLRLSVEEGERVEAKQIIGTIADPFGDDPVHLRAPRHSLVIGMTRNPVVHGGDALVHLGSLADLSDG
jgi:predicted deacylase